MKLNINTKIIWRTNGRGVTRVLSGTILALVKQGTLPKTKAMREMMPHGDKLSNRDRYIVEIKDGVFAWANAATCVEKGQKLPPHKPRIKQPLGSKTKAKPAAKVKPAAKAKPVNLWNKAKPETIVTNAAKKSGGDKPKATWYGIVDGKITSVRKVVCPEGFSKDRPFTAPALVASEAAAPAALAEPLPTA